MKKNFFLAAVVLAAMSSCSKDEVVEVNNGNAIAFRASLDRAISRGSETDLNNLQAFKVTAIGNDKNYFTNLVVNSSDGGHTWQTASTYYWPSFGLSFFAYAPQDIGSGAVSIDNSAKKITGFSPSQTVSEQKDLVIAYNKGDRLKNEKPGVALNFKHALSQIEVKAKCMNSNIKVEVLGVKVMNVAGTADFIFPEDKPTDSSYELSQGQWTNAKGTQGYLIKGTTPVTLTSNAQSIMMDAGNFMLIPQTLTKWDGTAASGGAYLSVLCRISSVDGDNEVLLYPLATSTDNKNGKYGLSAVAIDTNWLPGKKYTYTLTFCGSDSGAGRIDPNPNSSDSSIDPTPVSGGNGGDLILGAPIKFTVTVDNWTQVPVDVNMD